MELRQNDGYRCNCSLSPGKLRPLLLIIVSSSVKDMSYVLYSYNSSFDLTDRSALKGGISLYGSEIDLKKDGEMIKGVFLDEGTLKKMTVEKEKYVSGEKTVPKPSKKPQVSHLFDTVTHFYELCLQFKIVDAHESDDELGLEEERSLLDELGKLPRPVRNARNVKVEMMTPEPVKKRPRGNSLPPAAIAPPPSTVFPSLPQPTVPRAPTRVPKKPLAAPSVLPSSTTFVTSTPSMLKLSISHPVLFDPFHSRNSDSVTLEMIFDKLNDVQTTLSHLSSRQDRLERRVGDLTNDSVGIRHQVSADIYWIR